MKLSKKQQENLMLAGKILAILILLLVIYNLYRGKQGQDLFSLKKGGKKYTRKGKKKRKKSRK